MLILFNKPYGMVCQCTERSVPPRRTLAEFIRDTSVYPAGRLDCDSEGLLVLTAAGALAQRLTEPRHPLPKTYLVQVEGEPVPAMLDAPRRDVTLNDGPTLPTETELLDPAPDWL